LSQSKGRKGEVFLVQAIMAYGGLEVWLHSFLTWAVDWGFDACYGCWTAGKYPLVPTVYCLSQQCYMKWVFIDLSFVIRHLSKSGWYDRKVYLCVTWFSRNYL